MTQVRQRRRSLSAQHRPAQRQLERTYITFTKSIDTVLNSKIGYGLKSAKYTNQTRSTPGCTSGFPDVRCFEPTAAESAAQHNENAAVDMVNLTVQHWTVLRWSVAGRRCHFSAAQGDPSA